jgi:hypothetical protein
MSTETTSADLRCLAAGLADLTRTRTPWAAACDMDWSNT